MNQEHEVQPPKWVQNECEIIEVYNLLQVIVLSLVYLNVIRELNSQRTFILLCRFTFPPLHFGNPNFLHFFQKKFQIEKNFTNQQDHHLILMFFKLSWTMHCVPLMRFIVTQSTTFGNIVRRILVNLNMSESKNSHNPPRQRPKFTSDILSLGYTPDKFPPYFGSTSSTPLASPPPMDHEVSL